MMPANRQWLRSFLGIVLFALLPAATLAHHSLSALYDRANLIGLTGTIAEVQWVASHAVLLLDVPSESGASVSWRVEMDSPNFLGRKGIDRTAFAIGAGVTVIGYQSLDCLAATEARMVTFADASLVKVTTDSSWNWRLSDGGRIVFPDGTIALAPESRSGQRPDADGESEAARHADCDQPQ